MIPRNNQSRDVNRAQPLHVLHRFQIPINHELPVRPPHLAIQIPRSVAGYRRVVIRVRMILIKVRKISPAPRRNHVLIRVTVFLVFLAVPIQPSFLVAINFFAHFRRRRRFHPRQHLIHPRGARKCAAQNQMAQIILIFQRIRLRQHASVRMSQQRDFPQHQPLPHRFHILHHVFHRVSGGIVQLLRTSRAALINKNQPVLPRQRQKIWQKIIVRTARPAMDNHNRRAAPDRLVINQYAARIYVPLLDRKIRHRNSTRRHRRVVCSLLGSRRLVPRSWSNLFGWRRLRAQSLRSSARAHQSRQHKISLQSHDFPPGPKLAIFSALPTAICCAEFRSTSCEAGLPLALSSQPW